jgi:hypothetical protein
MQAGSESRLGAINTAPGDRDRRTAIVRVDVCVKIYDNEFGLTGTGNVNWPGLISMIEEFRLYALIDTARVESVLAFYQLMCLKWWIVHRCVL